MIFFWRRLLLYDCELCAASFHAVQASFSTGTTAVPYKVTIHRSRGRLFSICQDSPHLLCGRSAGRTDTGSRWSYKDWVKHSLGSEGLLLGYHMSCVLFFTKIKHSVYYREPIIVFFSSLRRRGNQCHRTLRLQLQCCFVINICDFIFFLCVYFVVYTGSWYFKKYPPKLFFITLEWIH